MSCHLAVLQITGVWVCMTAQIPDSFAPHEKVFTLLQVNSTQAQQRLQLLLLQQHCTISGCTCTISLLHVDTLVLLHKISMIMMTLIHRSRQRFYSHVGQILGTCYEFLKGQFNLLNISGTALVVCPDPWMDDYVFHFPAKRPLVAIQKHELFLRCTDTRGHSAHPGFQQELNFSI